MVARELRTARAVIEGAASVPTLVLDPDAPHRCSRCGQTENEDEHGQSVCEGCRQCSLCCGCGTFDDEEN